MAEHTYLEIADGYLRETSDPGRCAMIMLLAAMGRVRATKTDNGFSDLDAL